MRPKKEENNHKIINFITHPLDFKTRDIIQVIVGSAILAVPVGFTEETWRLGQQLPWLNIIGLLVLSFLFISLFVYYNYYSHHIRTEWDEFAKRVLSTYIFSFIVVAILLTIIMEAPWASDWAIAVKRVIIVTFPSSMSAAVADMIK